MYKCEKFSSYEDLVKYLNFWAIRKDKIIIITDNGVFISLIYCT